MTTAKPSGSYTVFDYNPRTRRFEQRSGPRGSTYTDRAKGRSFGKRSGPHNPAALPSGGGYAGGSASRVSRAMRAAGRVGLLGARANPVIRTINIAGDIVGEFGPMWFQRPAEYPDPSEKPDLPAGWAVSCFNAELPWDIGYGKGGQTVTACPGGNCWSTYTNPGVDMNDSLVPLNYQNSRGQWIKQYVSAGPANALWGTPPGRYAQKIKICGDGAGVNPKYQVFARMPMVRQPKAQPLPTAVPPPPVMSESSSPRSNVGPRYRPYQQPSVEFGPKGQVSYPPHNRAPAKAGTRERKGTASRGTALAAIAKIYDLGTEAKDVIDILYDNLGKKCPGAKSLSDKSYCVYKNLGTLNVGNSILELAKNTYEDKVYGKVFGTVGKYTPFGSMTPSTGPSRQPGPIKNLSARS